MKYKLTPKIGDGKSEAPPITVYVPTVGDMLSTIAEELCNDYGDPFGPGFTLTIERVE